MKAESQDQPKAWPSEGQQAEENTRRAMEQIKQTYAPPHGKLPAPHQAAERRSWGQALQPTTDVPGASPGVAHAVPAAPRRSQGPRET
jgi:hypothetical protein